MLNYANQMIMIMMSIGQNMPNMSSHLTRFFIYSLGFLSLGHDCDDGGENKIIYRSIDGLIDRKKNHTGVCVTNKS
mgnify:CR=1 FL=1